MTKTCKNSTLWTLPLVLVTLFAGSGTEKVDRFTDKLEERLKEYNAAYHTEKLYLLTDRFVYRPGEDIWFKGFVLPADKQSQSSYSQDVFIKIYNNKGEEIMNRRYPLINNQTSGRLMIPRSSIPGRYYLVAYTGWMKNYCPAEAFQKEILVSRYFEKRLYVDLKYDKIVYAPHDSLNAIARIMDPSGNPLPGAEFSYSLGSFNKQEFKGDGITDAYGNARIKCTIPNVRNLLLFKIEMKGRKLFSDYTYIVPFVSSGPQILFYPEGGSLVAGLKNTMAFKSLNDYGLPAVVLGEIIDQKGNVIQQVWTNSKGEGKFDYCPTIDSVFLRLSSPVGISKKYALPVAQKRGMVMRLIHADADSFRFEINSSEQNPTNTHWVAVMNKNIVWSSELMFGKTAQISIPAGHLESGIIQVSVFDDQQNLIAERLVRHQNSREQLVVRTDHKVYKSRQRVNVQIDLTGNTKIYNLLVYASLNNVSNNPYQNDLYTIRATNACVEGNTCPAEGNAPCDLDMLTSDYRNVIWEKVLSDKSIRVPYVPHDGLCGIVTDKKENPLPHAKVRISYMPNYRLYETQTDENGIFNVLFGSTVIDFKYLNIDAYDAMGKVSLSASIDQTYSSELQDILLKEGAGNDKQKILDILTYGEPDLLYVLRYGPGKYKKPNSDTKKKYDPIQYANYTNVLDIIQDIEPYQLIDNKIIFKEGEEKGNPIPDGESALIVINGKLKGNNVLVLNRLLPSDITNINISSSLVDVHKYTTRDFRGVIEITTIQGMSRYRQPIFQFGSDILNSEREFYSPNYAVESMTSVDNRKTLYWNPKVTLNPGESIIVSFYTSDVKGLFYGKVAGTDAWGNPVEKVFTFEVKE